MEQKMTSPASAPSSRRNRRGFTLIELIVVILIIALLGGILLPVILRAQRSAKKTRVAADFQTIGVALDAYRTDFSDYPRPEPGATYNGFAVLGRALISPGGVYTGPPAAPVPSAAGYTSRSYQPGECAGYNGGEYLAITTTSNPPTDTATWMPFAYSDGSVGPGFRVRSGGKVYPAYLQAEKFKMDGVALLDLFGSPILYYPARPAMLTLNSPLTPPSPIYGSFISISGNSLYNVNHNPTSPEIPNRRGPNDAFLPWPIANDFKKLLGDNNQNGIIETNLGESAAYTGPFILWSSGNDGIYGYVNGKVDDVANYTFKNLSD
jgi:prepilin-type N-terminal cleavage/methylation domain-containing protein